MPKTSESSSDDVRLDNSLGEDSSQELNNVVNELLNQLSNKFSTISGELLAKMDDMSKRLDSLEATIQGQARGNNNDSGK